MFDTAAVGVISVLVLAIVAFVAGVWVGGRFVRISDDELED